MTHLSSGQISEWILGERNPEVERHLEACGKCGEDIVRLQDGLLVFKQSVRDWAERPAAPQIDVQIARTPARQWSWRWAAIAAAAMSIGLLPMVVDVRQAQREAASAEDSLLLNQVNARLARTVPQPMEQLMELMKEGKGGPQ